MSREDWCMDSTVTIRLPSAMLAYLQKYTVDGGLSLSEAIRRIIGQHQIVVDRSDVPEFGGDVSAQEDTKTG